jgi:hypothetical protein
MAGRKGWKPGPLSHDGHNKKHQIRSRQALIVIVIDIALLVQYSTQEEQEIHLNLQIYYY